MASIVFLTKSVPDLGDSVTVNESADRIAARLSRATEGSVMDLTRAGSNRKIWIPIDLIGPIQES